MNWPMVSVLINNHNYGRFLGEAIRSALEQTYRPLEVIVVDDGSTDDSREVIEGFGERVIACFQPNAGQHAAINRGFAQSRGEIILLLDADDAFLSEKAAEVVRVFQDHPGIGWCFHPMVLQDVATSMRTPPPGDLPAGYIDFRDAIARGQLPTFAPATSALCFSRTLLEVLLPMPELAGTSADRYLKLAALILSPGVFLNKPLSIQKIHGGNAFTMRPEKKRVEAKSLIHTAAWLRRRFPSHAGLCNKLFAMGLGIYWRTGGLDPRYAGTVRDYLACTAPLPRWRIRLRACYHGSRLFAPVQRWRTRGIRNP